MTSRSQILRRGIASLAGLALAGCSMMSSSGANSVGVSASLSSAAEVPPNSSSATGSLQGSYNKDSKLLSWKLVYSGLSGPATMAHFHGPAMAGQNAGVVVPLQNPASAVESSATLTETQAADLLAGKWYINVHTATNPGGEIRGQVMIK
ncbi:MAG TPA: CHRD domain-containing protein [Burkholderiaceae bacterium]|nr:CHRD domain-containing protein [Burkholderiaceae bacterium]